MTAPNSRTGNDIERQRTIQQNKCLHQVFAMLSEKLNDGGYSIQETFTLPISNTPDSVKKGFGHVFMAHMFPKLEREDGTFSTSDLSTKQIHELFENINYATATKFGIGLDWPDRHNGGKC